MVEELGVVPTPLRGVCVRVPKTRAHHTRGQMNRVRGPPPNRVNPPKPGSDSELRQEPRRRCPHHDHPLSETTMDFATLTTTAPHASGSPIIVPPAIGLAHHPVLALDLGTTTGWALRS